MPSNRNWRCSVCSRTVAELGISTRSGQHLQHQRLCQGNNAAGQPLGVVSQCFLCDYVSNAPDNTQLLVKHYKTHAIAITDEHNLEWLRHQYQRHVLPDVDLNGAWGTVYSRKSVFSAYPELKSVLERTQRFPAEARPCRSRYLAEYREKFWQIFAMVPVTFSLHISSLHPQLIGSVWKHMIEQTSQPINLNVSKTQWTKCLIAPVIGTYGATFGSQAYNAQLPHVTKGAVGEQPTALDLTLPPKDLRKKIKALAKTGHIGVMIEIVFADAGRVLAPDVWENVAEGCHEAGLLLIVDEALTAVRCGAPFAHQRPEYSKYRPSMVLFGKGIQICGLAIDPKGVTVSKLEYSQKDCTEFATDYIDRLSSVVIPVSILLESLGTLHMVEKENWVGRSVIIGQLLRDVIKGAVKNPILLGLDALIYMQRNLSPTHGIFGASAGEGIVRWIPYLDEGMANPDNIAALFSSQSGQSFRKELLKSLSVPVCLACDDFPEGGISMACQCCGAEICNRCSRKPPHHDGTCRGGQMKVGLGGESEDSEGSDEASDEGESEETDA
ncbi:hypothetical protein F4861DRAFT_528685 [Xylaria intraflava]|nr:hypothetical protein F4861DRAFT_528685 [Xylaria intraflava]